MSFDFNQTVFQNDGAPKLGASLHLAEELDEAFFFSPEGQEIVDGGHEPAYIDPLVHCVHNHLAMDLNDLDAPSMVRVLVETIPRHVAVDSGIGQRLLDEARLLWQFFYREFAARQAPEILRVLSDPKLAAKIDEAIDDPANQIFHKTMIMLGGDEEESDDDFDAFFAEMERELIAKSQQRAFGVK